jgi:beta-glucosidase
MASFIDDLLERMTLDEKIGQLNLLTPGGSSPTGPVVSQDVEAKIRRGQVGGIFGISGPARLRAAQEAAVKQSRLGIPLLFGLDVIHGHKTVFPLPLALSCTWDLPLIEKSARLAAVEAAAEGLDWVFSPMVDISRDPRWGRTAEGSGEDAYLGARIAAAMVRGYQQDDLSKPESVMACVKHFALYGAPDGGRDYNTVDMSRIRMFESYLPPYKAAIDAGAGSVMASFNDIDGVPATGNAWLLTELLRKTWGFSGFVVSDYTGINEMTAHGLGDLKTVAALALNAGTDMDMVGEAYLGTLKQSVEGGKAPQEAVDRACRRVLEAKQKLGLFDDPFRRLDEKRAAEKILTADHRAAARDMAARSCVLLKNDNNILPLRLSAKIALVGPLAQDRKNMPGTWAVAGDWKDCVTVFEGMQLALRSQSGNAELLYARGCNITSARMAKRLAIGGDDRIEIDPRPAEDMLAEALHVSLGVDVIVAAVGEAQEMAGEASSRADIGIPPEQRQLLQALAALGKPMVLVVFSGRPLTLAWEHAQADAILAAWFCGTEAGNGIADVLFGRHNPSARLTMSFPQAVGQVPVYYNHKNTGRPFVDENDPAHKFKSRYIDVPNEPLYPFGWGLSYTTFGYGEVKLSKTLLRGEETLTASVTVTNAGSRSGEETVQLYISDPVASIARPVKDLRGFKKVFLEPGASAEVSFDLTTETLKFYNSALEHVWEPGEFIIHIGPNSAEHKSARVVWEK